MFIHDACLHHFTDTWCQTCVSVTATVSVTPQFRDAVIARQNLLIFPGWNGCCQDNAAPYLSILLSVVLPLLISLKSIIDAALSVAHRSSLFASFKWSQILFWHQTVNPTRTCQSFKFILMQQCLWQTSLCVYQLHQRALSCLEITMLRWCEAA